MGANPDVIRLDFWEGKDPGATMARLAGGDRTAILTAQIVSWSLTVIDKTAFPNVVLWTTGAAGVSGISFFDTLQYNDGWWRHNNKGYNFRHYVKWSDFSTPPAGDHMLWFEYRVVTAAYPGSWGTIPFRRESLVRAMQS